MRTFVSTVCAACALTIAGSATLAEDMKDPQQIKTLKRRVTKTVTTQYLIYLPKDYEAQSKKRWPLMLFLHGAGERGTNIAKVAVHGPPKLVKQGRDFPFIIVSPQCPNGERWDNDVLLALLDEVGEKYRVDESRVYLTGLSMGGYGAWSLGLTHPERFAAIAPICGGGNPRTAEKLKGLPIWVFHGAKDPTVPIKSSQDMVDALKAADAPEVKFTIYPEAGHDSWTETYNNPELYTWFLAHKRQPSPAAR